MPTLTPSSPVPRLHADWMAADAQVDRLAGLLSEAEQLRDEAYERLSAAQRAETQALLAEKRADDHLTDALIEKAADRRREAREDAIEEARLIRKGGEWL